MRWLLGNLKSLSALPFSDSKKVLPLKIMEKRNSHTLHVYCWKNIEPFIKYVCPPHCKDHTPNTQNNQKNPPQIPKKQIKKKELESEQAS